MEESALLHFYGTYTLYANFVFQWKNQNKWSMNGNNRYTTGVIQNLLFLKTVQLNFFRGIQLTELMVRQTFFSLII